MPDYLTDRDWKSELKKYKVDKDGGLGDALATFAKCRGKDPKEQVDALGAIVTKTAAAQKALKDQKELLKYVGQVASQAKEELKRVEAAAEEEGDEGKVVDKVLNTALKRAKTARMFFAVVARGAAEGKLIVTKAKVKPTDIADAKKEAGGGRVYRGVCFGEDGRLVFELKKEPPATLEKLIKLTAKHQAGLMIKPICRVGAMDEDLGEGEEDEDEQEIPVAPPTSESPKYAEEQVRKRLMALGPDLKRALSEKLGDTANIQRMSDQLRTVVGQRDFAEALTQLAIVEGLVRDALAGGKPGETKPGDAASEFAELVETLTPDIRKAIDQKGPHSKDLKLMFSEALTLGRGKKFEAALPKLRDAEKLLRKALEEESPEEEVEERTEADYHQRFAEVQKLFDMVVSRVEAGDADRADALRSLRSTAESAAGEGEYGLAIARLDELEAGLRSAERAASVREEIAQATGGGNVPFKALRARWANSQTAAQQALERFGQQLLSHPEATTDPRFNEIAAAVDKLSGYMPKFDGKLEDLLKAADEAPTAEAKFGLRQKAIAVIDGYEARLNSSPVIKQLDNTMFGKFSIYGEMANSLRQMKSALAARG